MSKDNKKIDAFVPDTDAVETNTVDTDNTSDTKARTSVEKFIATQLKAINKLNNPAKARRLADRVLRNRR